MDSQKLYEQIAERTEGDIYIGVVGPVRTGKSTFIKQFMETVVLPEIDNVYKKERAKDELPQSASGKTIMTAEPKFVPEEAVELALSGKMKVHVRLIDCVGYLIPGALGQTEDDKPRMVTTPWFDHEIPMAEAAEMGTRKVISEHSTIGLVVTTDGTITDFPRESYLEAEGRVIQELKALNKPFLVIVNSANPTGEAARKALQTLSEEYGVTGIAVNCLTMTGTDVEHILREVLMEFPVREIGVKLPEWFLGLPAGHELKKQLYQALRESAEEVRRIRQVESMAEALGQAPFVTDAFLESVRLGQGDGMLRIDIDRKLFFDILTEQTGFSITSESELIPLLSQLSAMKVEYDRFAGAIDKVRQTGYSIVEPVLSEMALEEPEIVRQGGQYGVKLRASAPSIHMIRADIQTEVAPIVGTEKQSEDLVKYLLQEFDGEPEKIWESNIFGKSLHELVGEGLNNKLGRMPEAARSKFQETLQRIINEGSGGLICIIL